MCPDGKVPTVGREGLMMLTDRLTSVFMCNHKPQPHGKVPVFSLIHHIGQKSQNCCIICQNNLSWQLHAVVCSPQLVYRMYLSGSTTYVLISRGDRVHAVDIRPLSCASDVD